MLSIRTNVELYRYFDGYPQKKSPKSTIDFRSEPSKLVISGANKTDGEFKDNFGRSESVLT